MSDFYIHRELHHGEQLIRDCDLLEKSGILVVLAEPGAGKSDLLDYFSRNLGVPRELAALFAHAPISSRSTLIIDALDEVARTNEETTNEIIVKARSSGAGTVIFASRSYVWDDARTRIVRDCFGLDPMILRLEPFDEDEQRQLFEHDLPGEDFKAFQAEAERFELTPILGNPQFLQLLASAYVEGGRRFNSKRQIYGDALRRLASESSKTGAMRNRPPTEKILAAASKVFAKLLLSGAIGVSAQEEIGDDDYPYLDSVGPDGGILTFALNTRLFKPTTSVNRHEPVHRIVAEYCAASFLVQHIEDSTNTLSIKRCLAIIAPNGAVRSELRGLLGWLASLGSRSIQEAVLELDPYVVFANGDPSQLLPSSKAQLLTGLATLARVDPYFRRMDGWRRFSVAGFFSGDTIDHVRPLLAPAYAESHLRGLLLELLHGSDRAIDLQPELRNVLRDSNAELRERQQAFEILHAVPSYDMTDDFAELIEQGSAESLNLASEMVAKHGDRCFGMEGLLKLMDALAGLYPRDGRRRKRAIGSLYFIDRLIETFKAGEVQRLLNEIAPRITCVCGKSKAFECTCRIGISKIAGRLLDRYFQVMIGPHDPERIAAWTMPLVFHDHVSAQRSASVEALNANDGLRRAIQLRAFEGLCTRQEIMDAHLRFSNEVQPRWANHA